jgi:hypothetical protein
MLDKSFEEIQKSDIDGLIVDNVIEHKHLEYKRDLPSGKEQDKIEYLADISSFANSSGGHIIYGLGDKRDAEGKNTGIPKYVGLGKINSGEQKLRLEQIIQNGIKPRIPGIQIKEIDGFNNGPIIIIRIPKSWAGPHMITLNNCSRFYSRTSSGKYQLDVGEIRMAFVLSETLPQRIRQFRIERVNNISAYKTPIMLSTGPMMMLHVIPFSAFGTERESMINIESVNYLELPPIGQYSPQAYRYNFDGLLTHDHPIPSRDHPIPSESMGEYNGYVQLFRNGIIEAVNIHKIQSFISCTYELSIVEAFKKYLSFQKKWSISLPIVISLTLIGVKDLYLDWSEPIVPRKSRHPIDRNDLIIPEVLVESFDAKIEQLMKPIFDTVWNAAGQARSLNYDNNGNWVGPRK